MSWNRADSIERIEDRVAFSNELQKMGIKQPPFVYVRNEEELEVKLKDIGLPVKGYFIKVPVFPFKKFPEEEPLLGPEMKSTGEIMVVLSAV